MLNLPVNTTGVLQLISGFQFPTKHARTVQCRVRRFSLRNDFIDILPAGWLCMINVGAQSEPDRQTELSAAQNFLPSLIFV